MELLARDRLPPFTLGVYGDAAFRLGRGPSRRQSVAVSADGRTLWYLDGRTLATVDAETGLARRAVVPEPTKSLDRVARAADDALLLLGYLEALWFDPRTDAVLGALTLPGGGLWEVAASPTDPTRAACVAGFGANAGYVFSRGDGVARPLAADRARDGTWLRPVFSRDGREVFVVGTRRVLRFDAATGEARGVLFDVDEARAAGRPAPDYATGLVAVDADTLVLVGPSALALVLDARGEVREAGRLAEAGPHLAAGPTSRGRIVAGRSGALDVYELPGLARVARIEGDFAIGRDGDALLEAGREVAWVVDARGAIHRADLAAGTIRTARPAHFPSALAWRGGELRVARFESPVETIDTATGASTFRDVGAASYELTLTDDGEAVFVRESLEGRRVSLRDGAAGPAVRCTGRSALAGERCWYVERDALRSGDRAIPLGPCKGAEALAASPSGALALVVTRSGAILVDLAAGAVRARYKLPGVTFARFVSEDEVVVAGPKGVRWVEAATGAVTAHAKQSYADRASVSQDGAVVAIARGADEVGIVTRDRPNDPVWFRGASHPFCVALSPDARRLAVAGAEAVVRVFDVEAALAARAAPKSLRRKG